MVRYGIITYASECVWVRAQRTRTFDGHLRLFPAFWAAILDPSEKGLKVWRISAIFGASLNAWKFANPNFWRNPELYNPAAEHTFLLFYMTKGHSQSTGRLDGHHEIKIQTNWAVFKKQECKGKIYIPPIYMPPSIHENHLPFAQTILDRLGIQLHTQQSPGQSFKWFLVA